MLERHGSLYLRYATAGESARAFSFRFTTDTGNNTADGQLDRSPRGGSTADDVIDALSETRERARWRWSTSITDEDLERVHSTLMSPLVWDLGHIAAFEDLWLVHRYGGRPLLREDLADVYDAFETPRAGRGELPFLRPAAARDYLAEVRDRTLERDRGARHRATARSHELVHPPRAAAQRDDAADDAARPSRSDRRDRSPARRPSRGSPT